jgi:hypothetical protein
VHSRVRGTASHLLTVCLLSPTYTRMGVCPSKRGLQTVSHEAHKITVSGLLNFLFTLPLGCKVKKLDPWGSNSTPGVVKS